MKVCISGERFAIGSVENCDFEKKNNQKSGNCQTSVTEDQGSVAEPAPDESEKESVERVKEA